jgi:hypothetical protein
MLVDASAIGQVSAPLTGSHRVIDPLSTSRLPLQSPARQREEQLGGVTGEVAARGLLRALPGWTEQTRRSRHAMPSESC